MMTHVEDIHTFYVHDFESTAIKKMTEDLDNFYKQVSFYLMEGIFNFFCVEKSASIKIVR